VTDFALIGLDPGFANLGYATLVIPAHGDPYVGEFGVFRTQKSAKKHEVLSTADNLRRAREIARFLRVLTSTASRDATVLGYCAEAMSFPRSAAVAAKMAMCWGALAALSEATSIPILQCSPQAAKKLLCGTKAATKEEVQHAVVTVYPVLLARRKALTEGLWEHCHDAVGMAQVMLDHDAVKMARRTQC
jgi:Holliday junction resolvasome RuvABC endonuclease subunit